MSPAQAFNGVLEGIKEIGLLLSIFWLTRFQDLLTLLNAIVEFKEINFRRLIFVATLTLLEQTFRTELPIPRVVTAAVMLATCTAVTVCLETFTSPFGGFCCLFNGTCTQRSLALHARREVRCQASLRCLDENTLENPRSKPRRHSSS